jgi:hypothetical protein
LIPFLPKTRRPIRRLYSEQYLLITLLSFAASVSFTRLFLQITGYPQIGRGELHIAHVLWGGLILFIATLIPLLLANRWAHTLSALLSGLGVGLFIDEVGKFITRTNDYFYPSAAPIIYAVFLLVVLLYIRIRRSQATDSRSEMYTVIQELEEVLDRDLSAEEKERILNRLERVIQDDNFPDLSSLALNIKTFLLSGRIHLVSNEPPWWTRFRNRLESYEKRWFKRRLFRTILAGSLIGLGFWMLIYPILLIFLNVAPDKISTILTHLLDTHVLNSNTGLNWFEARIVLEGIIGCLVLVSAGLFAIGNDRQAVFIGYFGLLLSLTVVNLLVFYFDQFSTIIQAMIQFIILLGLIRYRFRFLRKNRH